MTEDELRDEVNKQLGEINELTAKLERCETLAKNQYDEYIAKMKRAERGYDNMIIKKNSVIEWLEEKVYGNE